MVPIQVMLGNRKEGNMKKMFYGAAIVLTFFLSSTAFADYVIKLKNGRSVETERYWEEKDAIKFQYQGGVASVLKETSFPL